MDTVRIAYCPRCGSNTTFATTAHVMQEWKVDGNGDFLGVIENCLEVTHEPCVENTWTCCKCGRKAVVFDATKNMRRTWTSTELNIIWEALEDVPFITNEKHQEVLDTDWFGFPEGTLKEDIWEWFGERLKPLGRSITDLV